jgi:hypothetical protein
VRYCPNPSCSHRKRCGSRAEYEDRVAECSDCGAPLVAESELAAATAAYADGLEQPSRGKQPYRGPALPIERADSGAGRSDAATGLFLMGASVAITLGTYAAAANGGVYFIAVGPFFWGLFRTMRGLRAKDR